MQITTPPMMLSGMMIGEKNISHLQSVLAQLAITAIPLRD
jgi:hypothetical protein